MEQDVADRAGVLVGRGEFEQLRAHGGGLVPARFQLDADGGPDASSDPGADERAAEDQPNVIAPTGPNAPGLTAV